MGSLGLEVAAGVKPPSLPKEYAQTHLMLLLRFCERFGGWPFDRIDEMVEWQRAQAIEYEIVREQQEAAEG